MAFTALQNNNLAAYSAYLGGLTSSLFMLGSILMFVPSHRFSSWILRCNFILLSSSMLNFSLGTFIFHYALTHDLSVVLNAPPPEKFLYPFTIVLFIAGSVVRTVSEVVLLLRVQAVFPSKRSWHYLGFTLVVVRMLLEFFGKIIRMFFLPDFKIVVYLAIGLECFNNVLFTSVFLSKLNFKDNRQKQFKKRLRALRLIAVENSLLPTLCSILGVAMILLNVYPNGWNVLMLLSYVIGIPAASIWTSLISEESQAISSSKLRTTVTVRSPDLLSEKHRVNPISTLGIRTSDEFVSRPVLLPDDSEERFIESKSTWTTTRRV